MNRTGKYTVEFSTPPVILASAASVGKAEGEGPLKDEFDIINENDGIGSDTWEHAEAELVNQAVGLAIKKAGLMPQNIDIAYAGDLINQCTSSTFGLRNLDIPLCGLFGACSTFALALFCAALATDSGAARIAVAEASSHFCSAEKQFRYPLEYGGQRAPTTQRTATASGACVVASKGNGVKITKGILGRITDYGVTDIGNMGAAMAPAAARTISDFLNDTNTKPQDYDIILTGDLGQIGSKLFVDLMTEEYGFDVSSVHADCGNMLFDINKQDVHSGGSGCGCSASVVSSKILRELSSGKLKKVLFAATGALMSPLTAFQGDTIPAIAHAVLLCS
ncbi:MAG: stage V sporulation protein AD [Oscillospiraceae bacterium]|nr:stage V sporulation protein AD [Oscillospiraceae bacterium]